ncbi:MAG: alkaline phosphatase D family protein [Saprospiraceae bacterium]|nr:alkaline phosphatase D family protein [Saprospiraceae bacterium]
MFRSLTGLLLMLLPLLNPVQAQDSPPEFLQSGPMVGYSEMKEVLLWVQTKANAQVQFRYWEVDNPVDTFYTSLVETGPEKAFTAKLLADQVEPGKIYGYDLLIFGEAIELDYPTTFRSQPLWKWRTDAPDFNMVIGSCFYVNDPPYDRPGDPYGSDFQILDAIYDRHPDLMLWLGDNVYLREADWYSRTGILYRYTHTRSHPKLQRLLASTHHYATWDDHDYGPNNADRSYIHKDKTREAFELFWGNPTFGLDNRHGITTFFQWHDIEFFVLDNRYFRAPDFRHSGERTQLGKEQLEWLIDALSYSLAPFKMVVLGGQVLNTAKVSETYTNYYPEERLYLLERIEDENIKGVIFLTGDRHFTELSRYVNRRGNAVYDLTVSPLTAGVNTRPEKSNYLRVEGTGVSEHNFGLLEFTGPTGQRELTIRIINAEGEELWQHIIPQER